jgi:hypothetical protein
MKSKQHSKLKLEGFLIDFDGVISKKSIVSTLDFAYKYINSQTPISREFVEDYFKKVLCFSPLPSVELLFISLGINDKLPDFFNKLKNLDKDKKEIIIGNDFYDFLNFCDKYKIKYYILSLASSERLKHIKNFNPKLVYGLNAKSKADMLTFKQLISEMQINPSNWGYIEDTPIALRTGKLAKFKTFMMKNKIYNDREYNQFKNFIDYKVNSFPEIQKIIKQSYL